MGDAPGAPVRPPAPIVLAAAVCVVVAVLVLAYGPLPWSLLVAGAWLVLGVLVLR